MANRKSKIENPKSKIGLFGGSFNPIHLGHLILAEAVRDQLALDKVIFIPAHCSPHKSQRLLAPAPDRARMVRLAIRGNPRFEFSDIELKRRGRSYTVETLRQLHAAYPPQTEFFFLIGADTIPELSEWREIGALAKLCQFVVVNRPGGKVAPTPKLVKAVGNRVARRILSTQVAIPPIGISSTDIRRRVQAGRSIAYLVPAPVGRYIAAHALYR
ncbi:MAG: nicotinate-nucleotide adenylyltransferase [Planctomycetes bacterium]|nr:nicotinate-nucleotide adenylyltransferase [Planctomycetota bacterium]